MDMFSSCRVLLTSCLRIDNRGRALFAVFPCSLRFIFHIVSYSIPNKSSVLTRITQVSSK